MSCGVGCRQGSDLALPWLWRRPVATAPIRPLAWEPPYTMGAVLQRKKDQKKNQHKKTKNRLSADYFCSPLGIRKGRIAFPHLLEVGL